MNLSLFFIRALFFILSILFVTLYVSTPPDAIEGVTGIGTGILFGGLLGTGLLGLEFLFRRCNLRSFNIAILGLFFGYLMGQALLLVFDAVLQIGALSLSVHTLEIGKISLFLFGLYFGTILTLKSSDELSISIPFVRFSSTVQKKKDLLLDESALADPRLIDFATTGLLDEQLIVPKFLMKEVEGQIEIGDESTKIHAKKVLDAIGKLENLPKLHLRFSETDFPEIKDLQGKHLRLAKLLHANILSSDGYKTSLQGKESVTIITLRSLAAALKPIMQTGEYIRIKIQRIGKEPKQGVGYLDDGTMVVVNGGGSRIGETIEVKVLSVKHTSSGRMIFCNAWDNNGYPDENSEEEYEK